MEYAQSEYLLGGEKGADVLASVNRPPPAANGKRGARGFTLIELMVAITLLGILMALAMPSFTLWIGNTQVRSVAEALQNGLRLAQAEAVRRNQPVVMSFTNDANPQKNPNTVANGKNWSLQTVASAFVVDSSGTPTQEFIKAGALADVASAVSITGPSGGAICFNSSGRLTANAAPTSSPSTASCSAGAATFVVSKATGSDRPLHVVVQVGGQVRMCDPNRPTLSSTSPDGCPA
jgi:type IV fimbrial biogenesis protein FimT